jgi:DNA-binding HxlR family transcriptional regulator
MSVEDLRYLKSELYQIAKGINHRDFTKTVEKIHGRRATEQGHYEIPLHFPYYMLITRGGGLRVDLGKVRNPEVKDPNDYVIEKVKTRNNESKRMTPLLLKTLRKFTDYLSELPPGNESKTKIKSEENPVSGNQIINIDLAEEDATIITKIIEIQEDPAIKNHVAKIKKETKMSESRLHNGLKRLVKDGILTHETKGVYGLTDYGEKLGEVLTDPDKGYEWFTKQKEKWIKV